ncbi:hypothetical protein BBF96_06110 [Anoxybacter fermentans]|uniref:FAD-binding FR-type domain-containing protein n=1 Tax=Anoxybacter fermentans TaxID=1323375 RepID=A0A3S9SXC6_9FIRM|nr:dihydroorotate dehydrogenase electron transfer subunit [Anoxybacter fermentans]AZR73006.1 hypothetical protein BBF96_06110 [Anoxybacter fermentans]
MTVYRFSLIVNKKRLNKKYCLLGIHSPEIAAEVKPGQFINLQIPTGSNDLILKRPFSIHKVDSYRGIVYILFKIVGKGTRILSESQPGTTLEVLGPLGNGFTLIKNQSALLIGGGIGTAPLYQLATSLSQLQNKITLLLGLTDDEDLVLAKVMNEFVPKWILMKGNQKERQGPVTDLVREELASSHFDQIYACGPKPMLKSLQKMLGDMVRNTQFSMEEKMGCGLGLCFSCTCKIKDKKEAGKWNYERICIRGPVFKGEEVIFDE